MTGSPLLYGAAALILVLGTFAGVKSCEVERLQEANSQLRVDIKSATDANDSNMDTIATQGEELRACVAAHAADKAESERAIAAQRERADNLERRLVDLANERESEYESDEDYRLWADTLAPDTVFDRLRRVQAERRHENRDGSG